MKKDSLAMIRDLSNAKGPSGFEDEAVAAARAYTEEFDTAEDCLRNFYIRRKNADGEKPVFTLDAHSDEVGFMVHSIRPNGTLRFVTVGGWNVNTLPSSKVLVRNRDGEWISGIIAAKPGHFMTAREKKEGVQLEVSDLSIDVGATSAEEAAEKYGIRIGEPVVSDVQMAYDEKHDLIFGKGLDCRIGCAALIETMKRLKEEKMAVEPVGALSSQEEVGERGVRVAVRRVNPRIAVCFEGCPADDTFTEPYAVQTALKKGPMIRFMDCSVICSPRFQRYALDLAEEKGIPIQASVREGGGNNGAIINTALDGIPVIVVGIPVRYIHSHYGIASYADFEASVQLVTELVRSMSEERIASF